MTTFRSPQWFALVFCALGIPAFIVNTVVLYKNQKSIYFQKRGISLLWACHFIAIIEFYLMNIFTILHSDARPIYLNIWPFCMLAMCPTFACFQAGRFVLQFVNIKKQQCASEWKLHLDPEYRSKSFPIKHIRLFGNVQKISCLCVLFSILIFMVHILIYVSPGSVADKQWSTIITGITSYIFFAALCAYFTQFGRFFKFVDFWGINQQNKIASVLSLGIVIFLLVIIFIDPPQYETSLIVSNLWCSVSLLMAFFENVMYPYHIMKKYENFKIATTQKRQKQKNKNIPIPNAIAIAIATKKQSVFDLICDDKGYVLFMEHLQTEFCSENLLFVTTLLQFQAFLNNVGIFEEQSVVVDGKQSPQKHSERSDFLNDHPQLQFQKLQSNSSNHGNTPTPTPTHTPTVSEMIDLQQLKQLKQQQPRQQQKKNRTPFLFGKEIDSLQLPSIVITSTFFKNENASLRLRRKRASAVKHLQIRTGSVKSESQDNMGEDNDEHEEKAGELQSNHIVHQHQHMLANAYIAIYEKYISKHVSELEINISYGIFLHLLSHYTQAKQSGVIDDFGLFWKHICQACMEIYGLLCESHTRFKYYKSTGNAH